jgi:hypothetical protein
MQQETPRFKNVDVFDYPITPNETSLVVSRRVSFSSIFGAQKSKPITRSNSEMDLFDMFDKNQDATPKVDELSMVSYCQPIKLFPTLD